VFHKVLRSSQRIESKSSWNLNLESRSFCVESRPVRDPLIVPLRDPVIVPARDPVMVPLREPVIVPLVRDPGIVPPNEALAKDKVRSAANEILRNI
jgi:hypothetical protein